EGLVACAVAWCIQCTGHYYEGKKPAFVDDLLGLLTGPMFVTVAAMFALGWGKSLLAQIEPRVRPAKIRHTPQRDACLAASPPEGAVPCPFAAKRAPTSKATAW